jgi:hypothetical protein
MQPPNVRGWPGGAHWISTATLFQRYNLVCEMFGAAGVRTDRRRETPGSAQTEGSEPDDIAEVMAASDPPDDPELRPVRRRAAANRAYDPRELLLRFQLRSAADVVDFYVAHLLPAPLPRDKRAALVEYLGTEFDPAAAKDVARIRTMLRLLCSTPEYQLQ